MQKIWFRKEYRLPERNSLINFIILNKMKKIIFVWTCDNNSSFWIYSNNLINNIAKLWIKVKDWRLRFNRWWSIYQFIMSLLYWIKLQFSYWSKSKIAVYISTAQLFPPLLSNKNRIFIVHDLFYYDDWYNESKLYKFYYSHIHKSIRNRAFNQCKKIIAISNATKKDIMNKFWDNLESKIEVIYNWMDFKSFKPANKKNNDEKYVLYVWSELERKNLKNIIAAFWIVHKNYPQLKLFKAPNEKNQSNRNRTLEYIKNNWLEEWKEVILIKEYLSIEKLVELYQQAEIFCFPSLKEWFWFPIIEAQACWTPVITTNYEPMSELVPYKNMLVDPNDSEDIANKMLKIIEDKRLKEKLIREWLGYVKNFSWENTAKSFIDLFRTL